MELETLMYNAFLTIFGNELYFGMFIFTMFLSIIVFMKVNETAALVIFEPIFFMMFTFIPALKFIVAIAMGTLFGLALLKITRG